MKRGRNAPQSRKTTKTYRRRSNSNPYPSTMLNRTIVAERKYFDAIRAGIGIVASTTDWTGTEYDPGALGSIFAPVLGDDIFNRQSRKVQVLAIKISGQVGVPPQHAESTGSDIACIIRIHLVQDCQTNGAQLLGQNVFGANVNGEPIDMFQNPGFFGRFKVLKSKKFVMQNPAIASQTADRLEQNGLVHIWKMNVKFINPVIVHYNTTNGGTVADIVDNSWHVLALCSNADLNPAIAYRVRTTYVDV